jgi:serine/threonine-protein kinase
MLAPGTRLGVYEVVDHIGAGGMGEVYRARDTRLKRNVALKILPESFASDAERLARFQREAEVLASLNHPNIAAIYGLEESSGTRALVMELVEGETLAERIGRGAIPIDEALPIGRQIADSLEAAHEQGIIHRDLKPANIKVRPDGTVKVLDFGLAKLTEPSVAPTTNPAALSMSPTITSPALVSGVGVLLGTAAYMSPEQAKGRPADKRSDIWAFGCVLYEILAGQRAFDGDDVADTLANVLKTQPNWTALPDTTPPAIRRLLSRCLEKDRRGRLHDIGDARIEFDELHGADVAPDAEAPSTRASWRTIFAVAAISSVAGALATVIAGWIAPRPASFTTRLAVTLTAPARFDNTDGDAVAISPDGSRIVYVARNGNVSQLFVRRVDDFAAVPLSGTEGAGSPFFSPDGQWVAFQSAGSLKKVPISGKGAVTICRTGAPLRGGAWAPDDTIYFGRASGGPLFRVPASGGTPAPATQLSPGEILHRWPQITRDGKALVFTALTGTGFDTATIIVRRFDTGQQRKAVRGGTMGRYLEAGYLAYVSSEGLFVIPFDIRALRTKGSPVQIVADVQANLAPLTTGAAEYSVSTNGTLVYAAGTQASDVSVVWVDRSGVETPAIPSQRGRYVSAALSPDNRHVAVGVIDNTQSNIWVYDVHQATMNRLTFENGTNPVWTPDGQRLVYDKVSPDISQGIAPQLYWKRVDGAGAEEPLASGPEHTGHTHIALNWAPDARSLLMTAGNGQIALLDVQAHKETLISKLDLPLNAQNAHLSPDGKWLSYISGMGELYVQPFPSFEGRWQITGGTAATPRWRRDGKEIFYWDGPAMMVVPVTAQGAALHAGRPTKLFTGSYMRNSFGWDVSMDGQRFLLLKQTQTIAADDELRVVTNWFEELKARAPIN